MSASTKYSAVSTGLVILLLALSAAFFLELWGKPPRRGAMPPLDSEFTNTMTVRLSASELIRTEGDTSGLKCYGCHDEKKQVEVHLDADGKVLLPKEHEDLALRHGGSHRNDHCFNCHDSSKLEGLRTRDGRQLSIEQSPELCGSCHGPTLRDWEAGIHGRTSGYWDRKAGAVTREGCTSCHDPHAPAFPSIKPAPAPRSSTTSSLSDQPRSH